MDAISTAYLNAVNAGDEATATALLNRMFNDYGDALGTAANRLDEAAAATLGLFEAANELVAAHS
ncbi:hypothetical protein H6F75_00480 [Nodosilinea sp. FACHB-131]|uniref:hypothetical protein n=1 Tax=Cyanophyceae TaxID=3028117 RepID=UPI00168830CA|nr:hypothetical protein [Nodosilinea sp. FACHB-131]MBD1871946.1 hypothetical protein [Nodosilinea sp. FACHB-131]